MISALIIKGNDQGSILRGMMMREGIRIRKKERERNILRLMKAYDEKNKRNRNY
jgi:hypothetical protein